MLSVRRNVLRRRFNEELGAGVGVGGDVDVDVESSLFSWRTNKSSVLIAQHTVSDPHTRVKYIRTD